MLSRLLATAVLLAGLAVTSAPHQPHAATAPAAPAPAAIPVDMTLPTAITTTTNQLAAAGTLAAREQLDEWLGGQVAAANQHEAELEAQHATAPARAAAPTSGSAGSCTGFAVPDYIIQRESGGNPNAVNPSSGAYGCTQTLPSHYAPGGICYGDSMYSVDGQRDCTQRLVNAAGLSPWGG